MAPSTLDPDLLFTQFAALRASTVKVSFLHIEKSPLGDGIWNMSRSGVYDTIIEGPLHPSNLFPVPSPSLYQPRMNVQSARFHYRVLPPHPFQNSAVRANFYFAKHSPIHRRSLANTGSRSNHNLARGESIPRASLHSGYMRRMWRRYTLVRSGHPSGDDEPSPATLSAPASCALRGSSEGCRPRWGRGTRIRGRRPNPKATVQLRRVVHQPRHNRAHSFLAFRAHRGCGGPCAGSAHRHCMQRWTQAQRVDQRRRGVKRLQVQVIVE